MIDLGYLDLLEFGLTACRAAVPDVQLIAGYLVEDFEAMRRADEALGRRDRNHRDSGGRARHGGEAR